MFRSDSAQSYKSLPSRGVWIEILTMMRILCVILAAPLRGECEDKCDSNNDKNQGRN